MGTSLGTDLSCGCCLLFFWGDNVALDFIMNCEVQTKGIQDLQDDVDTFFVNAVQYLADETGIDVTPANFSDVW